VHLGTWIYKPVVEPEQIPVVDVTSGRYFQKHLFLSARQALESKTEKSVV
jgi:hypothetical protein